MNRLSFETSGNLPTILEEFKEYILNRIKKEKHWKMSTCTQLDWKTIAFFRFMAFFYRIDNIPRIFSDISHVQYEYCVVWAKPFICFVGSNNQGTPIVSYGWTCRVLRINRLKLKTLGGLPITLEEFMEYTSNYLRRTEGCQHVPDWTCKH